MMKIQLTINKNTKAFIQNLEAQIEQFSKQITTHGSNLDNLENEKCSVIGLRSRVVDTPTQTSDEKKVVMENDA